MGVDFSVETIDGVSLEDYYQKKMKELSKYGILTQAGNDVVIFWKKAKVFEFTFTDSIAKTALIQNGSDFVTVKFFIQKNEFDNVMKTSNIQ